MSVLADLANDHALGEGLHNSLARDARDIYVDEGDILEVAANALRDFACLVAPAVRDYLRRSGGAAVEKALACCLNARGDGRERHQRLVQQAWRGAILRFLLLVLDDSGPDILGVLRDVPDNVGAHACGARGEGVHPADVVARGGCEGHWFLGRFGGLCEMIGLRADGLGDVVGTGDYEARGPCGFRDEGGVLICIWDVVEMLGRYGSYANSLRPVFWECNNNRFYETLAGAIHLSL